MIKVLGTVGLNGSGKDTVIEYVSSFYGIPMVSIGDFSREIAIEKQISPTRENLTNIATGLIRRYGPEYFPRRAIQRIEDNGWELSGVAGIRTYDDVRVFKKEYGDGFLLIYIDTSQEQRYERLTKRGQTRDPKSYDEFLRQDEKEEQNFSLSKAIAMADVRIENNLDLQHLSNKIDELIGKKTQLAKSSGPSWFLVVTTFYQSEAFERKKSPVHKLEVLSNVDPSARLLREMRNELQERTAIPIYLPGPSSELDYVGLLLEKTTRQMGESAAFQKRKEDPGSSQRFLLSDLPAKIPRTKGFVLVGPDHGISLSGTKKALQRYPDLGVMIFDRYVYVRPSKTDGSPTNSYVTALKQMVDPSRITIICLDSDRGPSLMNESEQNECRMHVKSGSYFDIRQVVETEVAAMHQSGVKGMYLSINADSIEEFSTTSFPKQPEPFRLSEILVALNRIAQGSDIAAGDICGVAPWSSLSDAQETRAPSCMATLLRYFVSRP